MGKAEIYCADRNQQVSVIANNGITILTGFQVDVRDTQKHKSEFDTGLGMS